MSGASGGDLVHIDVIAVLSVENEPGEPAIHGFEVGVIVKFFGEVIDGESDSAAPHVKHFLAECVVLVVVVLNYPTGLRCPFGFVNVPTLEVVLEEDVGKRRSCQETEDEGEKDCISHASLLIRIYPISLVPKPWLISRWVQPPSDLCRHKSRFHRRVRRRWRGYGGAPSALPHL